MRQQIEEVNGRPYESYQVENEMKDLMLLCPQRATGGGDGIRGEIPMEIIAADSREKNKSGQSSRGGSPQQQLACLPYHQYGAQGDVETAENKKIE